MGFDISGVGLGAVISAIGGLGTAAFGLVEALKGAFKGINRIGLKHIQDTVASLTPDQSGAGVPAKPLNALPRQNILETVEANWVNGTDLVSQKAIAKSLIKLHLSEDNAVALAAKTNVDGAVLRSIAHKTGGGESLDPGESDVFSRFDLILTAMLDEAYQVSDQVYRNGTRLLAACLAVVLAVVAELNVEPPDHRPWGHIWLAVLVGVLATPLAPIAKDLTSALAAAVNTIQVVKK